MPAASEAELTTLFASPALGLANPAVDGDPCFEDFRSKRCAMNPFAFAVNSWMLLAYAVAVNLQLVLWWQIFC